MGLLDSVLGGVLGQMGGKTEGQGGLNPKLMLALGLLAMMAMRHKSGDGQAAAADADAGQGGLGGLLAGLGGAGALGGLLGGLAGGAQGGAGGLGGLLGGLLGGEGGQGNAGLGAAAGGIGALQQVLAQAGLGEQVNSWIGTGDNQPVSASQLISALGGADSPLASLAQSAGLSQEDVASHLSEGLPELINQLTPQGQVPSA